MDELIYQRSKDELLAEGRRSLKLYGRASLTRIWANLFASLSGIAMLVIYLLAVPTHSLSSETFLMLMVILGGIGIGCVWLAYGMRVLKDRSGARYNRVKAELRDLSNTLPKSPEARKRIFG